MPTDVLDFLREYTGATGVTVTPRDVGVRVRKDAAVLDFLKEETRAPVRANLTGALQKNPDQEVQIRRDAEILGLPPEATRNLPDAHELSELDRILQSVDNAPATQQLLADPQRAAIMHDDVDQFVAMERSGGWFQSIGEAFEQGKLTHRLGVEGFKLQSDPENVNVQYAIAGIRDRMDQLGVSNEGFLGFLTSAAEILGQQVEGLTQPEAAIRVGTGATLGAAAGLAGGPLAPVTSAVGAGVGLTAGFISHLATDSFMVESGHAYLEMTGKGVERELAEPIAIGVGAINAGLEMVGVAAITAPFRAAIKRRMRRTIGDVVSRPTVTKAAARAAAAYGGAVGVETATEITQELVAIAGEELARSFSDQDIDSITDEEFMDRIEDIAVKTFKGMTVLALPGAGVNFASERAKVKQSEKRQEAAEAVMEQAVESKVAARDPDVVAEHVKEVTQAKTIQMPIEKFEELIEASGVDSATLLFGGRLQQIYEEAAEIGGDVSIPTGVFTKEIVLAKNETFQQFKDDIRWVEGDLTANEAKEVANVDADAILKDIIPEAEVVEEGDVVLEQRTAREELDDFLADDPDVTLAQDSLGLQQLFKTGDEAGMTPKQYEAYLAKVQRASNRASERKKAGLIKKEQRKNAAEIKQEYADLEPKVAESTRNEPVYQAINGLGPDKLDYQSIVEVLGEEAGPAAIAELRKAGVLISRKGETAPGNIHIDAYAELHGFDAGDIMLHAMRDAKPEKVEIAERTQRLVEAQHPELFSRKADLQEAMSAVLHDDTNAVLSAEIQALSEDRAEGRVDASLVREAARQRMAGHRISDVSIARYMGAAQRHGREAGILLRKGNREGARNAKVQQLYAVQFVKEAEKVRATVDRHHKYLKQFYKSDRKWTSLGPGYLEAIRDLVNQFSLAPKLTNKKKAELEAFVKQAQSEGINVELPKRLVEDKKQNYRDLTLSEFSALVDKVKELHHLGREARKVINEDRDSVIFQRQHGLTEAISKLAPKEAGVGQRRRSELSKASLSLLNTDTMLRELDGFENLGSSYRAIKEAIDKSVSEGYREENMGLNNRRKKVAQDLNKLYSVFSKQEQNTLSRANITIPGFARPLSRQEQLSLLLNLGNADNRQALVDSGQVTEAQLDSLVEHASKRDMDFAQSVWDYLGSYWGEITAATERRRGYKPEQVEASPLSTPHGDYAGGYYPLRYDKNQSLKASFEDPTEAVESARFGRAMSSQTKHDHTLNRKGSAGQAVLLNLYTLSGHLDQVAYDLEMGDAVNETYAVLNSNVTKKAFQDSGRIAEHEALNLWLQDTITGEMHHGGFVENSFRWLRAGFTLSKLGWNFGVAALQPFGIIQASVQIGKANTLKGLSQMLSMPWTGERSVFKFVEAQSEVMKQRSETFNKDIADATTLLKDSVIARYTPKGTPELIAATHFYGIVKMQRLVDTWTWLAAKRDGMRQFSNDEALANEYADRMVIRTQASGNFQERTAVERGTLHKNLRQSEFVRSFTALASYFMAKTNVAYERTKKTNFKNPASIASWVTDMALLYTVEAALVSLVRGAWPDEDEGEGAVAKHLARDTISTMAGGVPFLREFVSEAQGFRGGGVFSTVIGDTGKLINQVGQGEMDAALLRSANNLGGILFKYPSSQLNKTVSAIDFASQGEDVEWIEFIMGPKWSKYQ